MVAMLPGRYSTSEAVFCMAKFYGGTVVSTNNSLSQFRKPGLFCLPALFFISLVTLLLLIFTTNVYSAQFTVAWNPNSESDLAGYKVYYGNSSGIYDNSVNVGNQTNYTIPNLAIGKTIYIAVTALDLSGNESVYSDEVIYNVPIGLWKLDEGSGTIAGDSSGNGNHGTIYGSATWTTGKSGNALDFDGVDDYVDVGDIDLTDAFTISAWINISSIDKNMIVGKSYSTYQFYAKPTGRIVFQRNSSTPINFNAGIVTDTWYHVAVTFNTTYGTVLYLDGSVVDTDSDTSITNENNVITKIGANSWTAHNFFNGTIDDVRIYNRVLSASEVLDLYNYNTTDNTPPYTSGHNPARNAVNVPVDSNITVHVQDDGDGVDLSSIVMTVNGQTVTPTITGTPADYILTYSPPYHFDYDEVVNVTIDVKDLSNPANVMTQDAYSFTTESSSVNNPPNGVIDTPTGNITINVGDSVNFTGTYSDPDGDFPQSFNWSFGSGSGIPDSTLEDPGLIQFNNPGNFIVTFTVTDALGLSDPTPATLNITVQSVGIDPSLVGYWTLDEGAGLTSYDYSGNGNDGVLVNGPTWTTGQINQALGFDGVDDYVSIPVMNNEEISIAAWFYKNSNDTTMADAIFGAWRWDSDVQLWEGFDLRFYRYNPDKLQFILVTENGSANKTVKVTQLDLGYSVGRWFHAVGTYSKTTGKQKLYVDGQLVETKTHPVGNTIAPLTSYSDMRIGHSRASRGFFDGAIDEVRIYNRALSDSEILGLYNK
jgi:hypothetical protein